MELFFFFSITISVPISITVFLSVTVMSVLAILAVAIVGTGFALVHVNAIEQHAGVGQLAVLFQLVDEPELTLGGVAGAAYIHA